MKTVYVPFVGERLAREAGRLLGASGLSDIADALVVAEARRRAPATIVTGDSGDLSRLVEGQAGIRIIGI